MAKGLVGTGLGLAEGDVRRKIVQYKLKGYVDSFPEGNTQSESFCGHAYSSGYRSLSLPLDFNWPMYSNAHCPFNDYTVKSYQSSRRLPICALSHTVEFLGCTRTECRME